MDDAELNKVLDNVAKYVKYTPMGLQNFKNNKKFEHALARITDTEKMTGGGGTVTATYLPACEEDEDLRKHFLRHRSIVLLKVGKEDAARAIVAPSPTEFHSILCCYGAEHRPLVLRLLLEEFVLKSKKCHAMLSAFLLVFFAVLFSEDRDDFKRLLAGLWSVESVRELLKAGYKWSKPSEYLETATIDMPEYAGELPPGWQDSVLPSLGVFPQAGPAEERIEEATDVEMAANLEDSEEVADFEMAANLEDSGVEEAVEAHVAEDAIMEEAVAEAAVKDEPAGDEFYDALDLPLDDDFDVKDFLNGEYAAGDRSGPSNVPLVSPRINNQLGRQRGVPVKEDYKDETKVPRARHNFSTRGVSGFVVPTQRLDAAPRLADNCRPRKRPPKKRDLLSSAEPSAKSPRFDGDSDMAAQSTSMTAQVQPPETVKERRHKVLEGRLEDKRLTDVNGIDKRAAKSLEHKVWTVESLFAQFLVLKKNRQAFLEFLAAEVPLSPEDAVSCYECLRDYTAAHV